MRYGDLFKVKSITTILAIFWWITHLAWKISLTFKGQTWRNSEQLRKRDHNLFSKHYIFRSSPSKDEEIIFTPLVLFSNLECQISHVKLYRSLCSFSFFTVFHSWYEYPEPHILRQHSISLSSLPLQTPRPIGGVATLRGCVSLARFQDLALVHWTRSARKDAVQRGIHHLRLLSSSSPPPCFISPSLLWGEGGEKGWRLKYIKKDLVNKIYSSLFCFW